MDCLVRYAEMIDLPRIGEIYAFARKFMAETGNPNQWGTHHPPVAQLEKDVANRKLYVIEDVSGIHGVFYFAVEDDPTYHVIHDGDWHADQRYGVIHRIAGDGSGGILRKAVEFASLQTDYLRIDTHHDNQVMQRAVEKLGYIRCGIIYIADGSPRIAYDRINKSST